MKTLQMAQQATSHIFADLADFTFNGVVANAKGDMIIVGDGLAEFMKANYEDTSNVYLDVRIIDFLCDRPVEIEYFVATTHKGLPYIFPVSLDSLSDLNTVIEIFDCEALERPNLFEKHPTLRMLNELRDFEKKQETDFINDFFGVDEDVEQEMNDAAVEALEALTPEKMIEDMLEDMRIPKSDVFNYEPGDRAGYKVNSEQRLNDIEVALKVKGIKFGVEIEELDVDVDGEIEFDDFEEPRSECDAWEEKCDNEDCAYDSFGRGH